MPKAAWAALALFLGACAASGPSAPTTATPEAEVRTPGMIPPECEALLQKSQEWGYIPGQPWKPKDDSQALSALQFFSSFHFVPEPASNFWGMIARKEGAVGENEAASLLQGATQVMPCDFALALQFLHPLAQYKWPKADRAEASRRFLQFFVNQQARTMPLMPRLAAITLHIAAAQKGLAPGPVAQLKALQGEGDKTFQQISAAPLGSSVAGFENLRKEIAASDKLREKIARFLPLP